MAEVEGAGEKAASEDQPNADDKADKGVPENLRYIGIGVGLLLLFGGLGSMAISSKLYGISVLAVCVGFGITLAVFGSQANGKFLHFNLVGSGATAVALYLLLYYLPIHPFESYVRGKIGGTGMLESVAGKAREDFFVGRASKNDDYKFIIFEDEIGSPQLYFLFQFSKDNDIYIGCIDSSLFGSRMGEDREVALTLEPDGNEGKYALIDNETNQPIGRFNERRCSSAPGEAPPKDVTFDFLSMKAYAADESAIISDALARLDSDDASQRDDARTQLAGLTLPESYTAVARSWHIEDSSYRQDLGRLVAWSEAIKLDRKNAVYIAQSLSPEQLSYLVQLTGQGDITLRQQATEVLHRLLETTSWPSGPPPLTAQAIVKAVTDLLHNPKLAPISKPGVDFRPDNRLYNTIVAIGFTDCNIAKPLRDEIAGALGQLSITLEATGDAPKTLEKLGLVLRTLSSCAS